ncbi:MAG: DUF2946 family protein [Stellaceae bacterium]
MRRGHLFTAWLAIVALLLDGLLPTAVSAAAATSDAGPRLALCSTTNGNTLPGRPQPNLPPRHCALCAICAGSALGLLPSREGGPLVPVLANVAHLLIPRSMKALARRFAYAAPQPRAPPRPAS